MDSAGAHNSLNILLVEDNPDDVELIRESLLDHGRGRRLNITGAETLADATSKIKNEKFEAVLLDLRLPDSAGLETFEAISKIARATPVIVLSGMDDRELSLQAVRLGAQDYLIKGTSGREIFQSILYAIERKSLERLKDEFVATVTHELKTPAGGHVGGSGAPGNYSAELAAWRIVPRAASS